MNRFRRTDETTLHVHDEERLSAYLDGELSPQERDEVQQHLAECPDCQWNLTTLRQSVQWTKELPTVSLTRAFTVPVKVERERAPRRRSALLPVLQGATALVALLLFVVMAGDFWFNGFQFARAPMPEAVYETTQVGVQATQVAEEVTEAPAALKVLAPAPSAPEAEITQEIAVAAASAATAAPAPAEPINAAAATEAAAATMAPAGMGVGGEAGATPAQAQADQATRAAAQPPSEAQPFSTTVQAEPPATIAATEAASAAVVAEAPALTEALPAGQERGEAAERFEPGLPLLRVVELGLAVALLLCIAAAFLLALQRRRAR